MGHLSDKVREALAQDPSAPGLQFKGQWRTWGELNAIVQGLDAAFDHLGLGAWSAIGCVLRNRPEHAAAIMGIVSGDRCLVTLNALLPDEKLAADIAGVRPPVLVALAEDWNRPALVQAARDIGAAGVSLTGDPERPVAMVAGLESVGPGPHNTPPEGTSILMLTSGTTGTPKRAPLKMSVLERQLIEASGGQRHGGAQGATPAPARGIGIQSGSFVHIGGVWGLLGSAMGGRPSVLLEKFNVPDWRAAVVEHRPASAGGPPAALRMILDADLPPEDLASIKTMGAGTAALDPEIADEFHRRYGIAVLTNYGATEFAGGVASWSLKGFQDHWTAKRGAVGRVHNSMQARIVDPDTGDELPNGQEGILELRGFATGQEDWIRTSDRGVLDDDRYLWIRGRADNAILRGGFKVQPDEVVAALQAHPAVAEASVVGIPDRRLGQVPVAALVLKPGAERPSDPELEAAVRSKLMAYCVPAAFRVVDELPRTPSMKVSMPAVRDLFEGQE